MASVSAMMAVPPDRRFAGAVGLSEDLFQTCSATLEGIVTLEPLPSTVDVAFRRDAYTLIVVGLSAPLESSVAEFCALRRAYPLVSFLVLARDLDANLAVELLKLGAEDFLLVPPDLAALKHKVRRMLGEASGPAFERAELAAFRPREFDQNERRCFRVNVLPDFSVATIFPGPIDRPLDVKDLSIETDAGPGGMQVCADLHTARRLPFDQWGRRREIDVTVRLPTGSPVVARGRLVPGLRNAGDGTIRFAIEYWVTRPADKERFRRYWVEAQRRMCRTRR